MRTLSLAGDGLQRELEALVQGHQERGGGQQRQDEAHAVLRVLPVRQLLRRLQPAPVAAAEFPEQRQRLRNKSLR